MGSSRTAQQAHRDAINLERMLVRLEQATSSIHNNKQQQDSTRPSQLDYDYYKTLSTLSSIRNAKRMLVDDTVHDQQTRHALEARLDKLREHYQGVLENIPKPISHKHIPNLEHLRPRQPPTATLQAPSQSTPQAGLDTSDSIRERTQVNPELTEEETRRTAAEDNLLSLGDQADEENGSSNLRRRSSAGPNGNASLSLQPFSDLDEGTLSKGSSDLPPASSASRSTGPSHNASNPTSSTQSLSNLLSHHRSEQESLTEELAQMAGRLKMNSLGFAQLLEKDKTLLQSADEKLEGNLGGMIKERDRLKEYKKTGGVTMWFIIGSVAAVMAAWLFMFALMRIF